VNAPPLFLVACTAVIHRLALILIGISYVRAVHSMIDDIARRAGITLIDLAPAFREQTRSGRQLVYPIDAHWTPAGHQVAAEYLLRSVLFQPDRP
jgi:SGNH hydrolase-like domain, acetyltransferase AlgX